MTQKIPVLIIVPVLIILMVGPIFSQEYEIWGDAEFRLLTTGLENFGEENSDPSIILTGEGDFNHRLYFDRAVLSAGHLQSLDTLGRLNVLLYEAAVAGDFLDWLSFGIGRHRIDLGMGTIFTPADTLHPLLVDQKEQIMGFDGISLTISPNSWFGITAAGSYRTPQGASPELHIKNTRWALQVSSLINVVDLYASAVFQYEKTARPAIGLRVDAGGFLLTLQGAYEFYSDKIVDDEFRYNKDLDFLISGGVEKTFYFGESSLFIGAEYLFNGLAYSESRTKFLLAGFSAVNSVPLIAGGGIDLVTSPVMDETFPMWMAPHYIGVAAGYEQDYVWSAGGAALINIRDLSALISFEGSVYWGDFVQFGGTLVWAVGAEDDEFFVKAGNRLAFGLNVKVIF